MVFPHRDLSSIPARDEVFVRCPAKWLLSSFDGAGFPARQVWLIFNWQRLQKAAPLTDFPGGDDTCLFALKHSKLSRLLWSVELHVPSAVSFCVSKYIPVDLQNSDFGPEFLSAKVDGRDEDVRKCLRT